MRSVRTYGRRAPTAASFAPMMVNPQNAAKHRNIIVFDSFHLVWCSTGAVVGLGRVSFVSGSSSDVPSSTRDLESRLEIFVRICFGCGSECTSRSSITAASGVGAVAMIEEPSRVM